MVSHAVVNRYERSGPDLLTGQWAVGRSEKSRADISDNALALFSNDPKTDIDVYQDLSSIEHGAVLRLSADMKCDNVKPGEKLWNRARLLLVQNDGKADRWDLPHGVASLAGALDWKNYYGFFTINPDIVKIRVIAQLSQSLGSFELKNIRLYPVSQAQVYAWIRNGILFSWGTFFLLLIGSCFFMGRKTIIFRILLASAFIAVIIGTTLPGEIKNQVSNEIRTQINSENQVFKSIVPWDLTKIGHFCFFALFGTILGLMITKEPAILVMTMLLLLAGGTEMAQFYIDGRSPLFSDFFLDSTGGLFSIILIRLSGMNKL